MRKIWVIARRELYETYTNTSLIVIMLVTPLSLATIIGLALGGVSSGSSIQDIPVAIVNLDEGTTGDIFVNIFLPDEGQTLSDTNDGQSCASVAVSDSDGTTISLQDLTDVQLLDDVETARAGVAVGDYAAAIILPPNLSQDLTYSQDNPDIQPVTVQVLADPARTTSADIITGISESILNQLAVGNITVAATIDTIVERAQSRPAFGMAFALLSTTDLFQPNFACAFDPSYRLIQLEAQTLGGEAVEFSPFVYFGSANAMFFLLFTAQGGANSILEDRRQWVLQRLIMSPTSRVTILMGKLVGTLLTGMLQLVLLFIAFTVIGSLMSGELTFIWGQNWLYIIAMIFAASLSASGLGTILSALAKSPDQANVVGTMINIAMGAVGGAFFVVEGAPSWWQWLERMSLVYWGSDGFRALSVGNTDIGLNLMVMLIQGGLMFLIGLWIFNRRLEE